MKKIRVFAAALVLSILTATIAYADGTGTFGAQQEANLTGEVRFDASGKISYPATLILNSDKGETYNVDGINRFPMTVTLKSGEYNLVGVQDADGNWVNYSMKSDSNVATYLSDENPAIIIEPGKQVKYKITFKNSDGTIDFFSSPLWEDTKKVLPFIGVAALIVLVYFLIIRKKHTINDDEEY